MTALISPIAVASQVVRKEIPILLGITLLSGALLLDGHLDRTDAVILGVVFVGLMGWSIRAGMRGKGMRWMRKPRRASTARGCLKAAIGWLIVGLVLLIAASRLLVWGR